jgi:AraC-like DNA-binding protein/quercetin dioxygenase-like cupin family protein
MAKAPCTFSDSRLIGRHTSQHIFTVREIPAFSEFHILFAGITEANAGYSWMRYDPEVSQLLTTVSGEGEVLIANKWTRIRPGSAYLTSTGVPHAYRAIRGKKWTICWVNYLGRPTALSPYLPDAPVIISVPAKQLWLTFVSTNEAIANRATPLLLNLWGSIIHHTVLQALKVKGAIQQLGKLWEIVQADLAHPWGLDELARKAGMSKENLRRICLKERHCSPMRLVSRMRFQKAVELLSQGQEKIQTIAELLGYGDPFTFSAAFKREMGFCPSRFR